MCGNCKSPTPVGRTKLAAAPEEQCLKFVGKLFRNLCTCWHQATGATRAGTSTRSAARGGRFPCSAKTHTLTTKYPDSATIQSESRHEGRPRRGLRLCRRAFRPKSQNSAGSPETRCETAQSPNTHQTARTHRTISHPNGDKKRAGNAPRLE